MRWAWLAGALLTPPAGAQNCGDALGAGARRIDSVQFQLAYKPTPETILVGKHFSIDFVLCPRDGATPPAEVRVDATMPEHRHGMNYRPSVISRGAGVYRAEGLMFHMPGRWELVFELRGSGTGTAPLRLSQSLQIG